MSQQALSFSRAVSTTVGCKYLLHLPQDYGKDARRWPLIMFLHGAGERGDNLNLVRGQGLARRIEKRPDFPFIVVSPQCPEGRWWWNDVLIALLDDICATHAVDESRIYLTGMSMGGSGAWSLAAHYPDRFAAVAPICGRGATHWVWNLNRLPIWVFHGKRDGTVPFEESERLVEALKKNGGNVRFTIYPHADHDSWTEAYDTEELYTWFLSHRRKS